jgi:hypothetical protein
MPPKQLAGIERQLGTFLALFNGPLVAANRHAVRQIDVDFDVRAMDGSRLHHDPTQILHW